MSRKKPHRAGNPRFLALDVLTSWQRLNLPGGPAGPSLDDLLAAALAANPTLSRSDQALLRELATGVCRWRLRLDYALSQVTSVPLSRLHPVVLAILRLTAYQLLCLERIPAHAAVDEAVNLAKARRLPPALVSFVNAVARTLAAQGRRLPLPDPATDPVQALAVTMALPHWLAARWLAELGPERAWQRAWACNQQPPLTLRVNLARTTPEQLQRLLAQEGVAAQPCRFSPCGLTLRSLNQSPFGLPSHQQGLWLFQDEAAQLATLLLQVQPGQRLLEIGAGRGGKTSHLAQMLAGQGLIVAVDHSRHRLTDLRRLLARMELTGVIPLQADASQPLPLAAGSLFDRILIDAPCSGLGVLRRHPELKWRRQPEDIDRFVSGQEALLAQAADYLRPGGLLLYITCTMTAEENDSVVQRFLAERPDYALVPASALPASPARNFLDPQGYFRTTPEEHGLDGFFAALLIRR